MQCVSNATVTAALVVNVRQVVTSKAIWSLRALVGVSAWLELLCRPDCGYEVSGKFI